MTRIRSASFCQVLWQVATADGTIVTVLFETNGEAGEKVILCRMTQCWHFVQDQSLEWNWNIYWGMQLKALSRAIDLCLFIHMYSLVYNMPWSRSWKRQLHLKVYVLQRAYIW